MKLFDIEGRFRAFLKKADNARYLAVYRVDPELVLEDFLNLVVLEESDKLIKSIQAMLADNSLPDAERGVCAKKIKELKAKREKFFSKTYHPCANRRRSAQWGCGCRPPAKRWLANRDPLQEILDGASSGSRLKLVDPT